MAWQDDMTDATNNLNNMTLQLGNISDRAMRNQVFQYNKDLQQEIFAREDNAAQRRAADLEAAGLSKTLAAGGGANAGAVIDLNPNEYTQTQGNAQAIQAQAASSQMALTRAQVQLAKMQKNKLAAETVTEIERSKQMQSETGLKANELEYSNKTLMWKIEQMDYATVQKWNDALKSEQEVATASNRNMYTKYESMIEKMKYEIMGETGMEAAKAELLARQSTADYLRYEADRYIEAGTIKGGVLPSALTSWLAEFNQFINSLGIGGK